MNQIEVVVSVLAAACLLALPASAKRGEQGGPTPLFPDDASARAGDLLSLAVAEMEGGRYDGAAAYLRRGASDGDLRCTYALGMLTLEGKGTQRDATLASDLLREAAMAGLPEAQTVLGLLYASGEGVEKDAVMAAEWYRKAARGGDPLGQAAYGAVLFLGVGVQRGDGSQADARRADQGVLDGGRVHAAVDAGGGASRNGEKGPRLSGRDQVETEELCTQVQLLEIATPERSAPIRSSGASAAASRCRLQCWYLQ
jgi:hypothetical protein